MDYQEISPGVCVDNYQNRVDCKTGKIMPYTPPVVPNTGFSTFGNQNVLSGTSNENSVFSNNIFNPSVNIQGNAPSSPINPELSKYYKKDDENEEECFDEYGMSIPCKDENLGTFHNTGSIDDNSFNQSLDKSKKTQEKVKSKLYNKNSKYYPYIAPIAALNTGLAYFSELTRQNRSKQYEQNNLSNPYNGILGYNTAKNTYDVSGSPFTNYYNYKKGGMFNYKTGGDNKCYDESGNEIPCVSKEDDSRRINLARSIVENAKNRIKNNKYVEVPESLKIAAKKQGEEANGCIGGVCTVLKESGAIPNVDWSNTSFALNTKKYGFSNEGKPVKGIDNLEEGDVLQYLDVGKLNEKTAYPHHAQILVTKGDDNNPYKFFDNFWKQERSYSKKELTDLLKSNAKKSDRQANIYKINPYKQVNSNNAVKFEDLQNSVKDSESFDRYSINDIDGGDLKYYPAYYLSDKYLINNNKKEILGLLNDESLDKQIQKAAGISASELSKIKPLVYGMFGQESNYGNPKSRNASLKLTLENLYGNTRDKKAIGDVSLGNTQVKYDYISPSVKKEFGINSGKDLINNNKNSYIAAIDALNNAKKYTNAQIASGKHPEMKDLDEYERALYWVNSPGKVAKEIPQEEKDKYEIILHMDKEGNYKNELDPKNFSHNKEALEYYNKYYLNIDKGSYPWKVLHAARDLNQNFDFEKPERLPEVVVKGKIKKKFATGGLFIGDPNQPYHVLTNPDGYKSKLDLSLLFPKKPNRDFTPEELKKDNTSVVKINNQLGSRNKDNIKEITQEEFDKNNTDTRSFWSDSRAKQRGNIIWNNTRKLSTVGEMIPFPIIRYPSMVINSAINAVDTYDYAKSGNNQDAVLSATGIIPIPSFNTINSLGVGLPSAQKKKVLKTALALTGLSIFNKSSDLTNNFTEFKKGGLKKECLECDRSYKKKMEEGGDYVDEYLDSYLNEDDSKKKSNIDNSAPSEQELEAAKQSEENDLWEKYNNDLANQALSLSNERKNKSYANYDDSEFSNDSPSSKNEASLKINQVSQKYGVPSSLLYGVWGAESAFGKRRVNKENSAGAKGHFQFTKGTAKQYGLENREDFDQSLDASARYFSDLYKKFGNWNLALAGYNAGPGNVVKYKGVPPFKETRNYIKKVNKYASQY